MKIIKVGCLAISLTVWPFIVIPLWVYAHRNSGNDMEGVQFTLPALLSWLAALFVAIYGAFFIKRSAAGATKLLHWTGFALCLFAIFIQVVVFVIQIWRSYHLGDYLTRIFDYDVVA